MFKIKKNDPVSKELNKYASDKNKALKEILISDEHLDDVCNIFYPNLPKLVRMAMNKEKFKTFYKTHRNDFANQLS